MSKLVKLNHENLFLFSLISIIILFFTRGTVVGDQERILFFIKDYLESNQSLIYYLKNSTGNCNLYPVCNYNYLGHHLGWFLYLLPLVKLIFSISVILNLEISDIELEFLISISDTLILLLSFLILFKFAYKKYDTLYASCGISFFLCSYGVGFLNGGFVEINLILLISLKIFLKEYKPKNLILVTFIDVLIIYLKLYSIIFIVMFLPLYKYSKKEYQKYLIFFIFFITPLIYLKLLIPVDYLDFYQKGVTLNFLNIFEIFLLFFLSPSLGLFFNSFFFILILFNYKNKIFIYKFLIIIILSILFSAYKDVSFWGGAGISGSRYIFPFLIIFYDEFICLLKKIDKKNLKYIILLFMIIFYPSLDYKNSNMLMVPEQTGVLIVKDVNNFPLKKFEFNGPIFSWKIKLNQLYNKQTSVNFLSNEYVIQSENIIPDTLLSKIIYVMDEKKLRKSLFFEKYQDKYNFLMNKGLNFKFVKFLYLLITFLYFLIPFIIMKKLQNK